MGETRKKTGSRGKSAERAKAASRGAGASRGRDAGRKAKGKARGGASRRSSAKKKTPRFTAATADKHDLYQRSVQDPEVEIAFINRVYKRTFGTSPLTLREDFCGTAYFCAEWIKSGGKRSAVGIDLDQPTLDWGIERNLSPLGEPGNRIRLLNQNVLDPLEEKFDVAVALNFSYWVFKERADMLRYFRGVRAGLEDKGLFFLDAYGGPYSMEAMDDSDIERTAVEGGFTYVWDQHSFNAVDHEVVNHIHFEFKDGTELRRAFSYNWRFWTLPELRDVLTEAGFSKTTVYWEDEDDEGEGTGVYRARKRADNGGAWVSYLIAQR